MLGFPDRALVRVQQAATLAAAEKNVLSEATAYQVGGWIHQLRGEPGETLAYATQLAEVSVRHGFVQFQSLAQIFEGWVHARSSRDKRGCSQISEAIRLWKETGARLALTCYTAILGDACLASGAIDEGFAAVREAIAGNLGTEERCYHPELHRLEAEFLLAMGNPSGAETSLDTALALAWDRALKAMS